MTMPKWDEHAEGQIMAQEDGDLTETDRRIQVEQMDRQTWDA